MSVQTPSHFHREHTLPKDGTVNSTFSPSAPPCCCLPPRRPGSQVLAHWQDNCSESHYSWSHQDPFWAQTSSKFPNPYHLKIPQIQLQGYALVTSERSAQVRWIYNFLFEIQLFTKRRKPDFCSANCTNRLIRYRSWRKVVTWPKCSVSEKPTRSARHQTSTSGKIVILIMTM